MGMAAEPSNEDPVAHLRRTTRFSGAHFSDRDDEDGRGELVQLILCSQDEWDDHEWGEVLLLINEETCRRRLGVEHRLPLHWATCAKRHVPENVVRAMVEAYPEACHQRDGYGALPLHGAVANGRSLEIVDLLVDQFPRACRVADGYYNLLPLQLAAVHRASAPVLNAVLQRYPRACSRADLAGRLPLHLAIENGVEELAILKLIEVYPKACRKQDKATHLPLHTACKSAASPGVVHALLKAKGASHAISTPDRDGRLPLHWAACHKKTALESARRLVDAYLEALSVKDAKWNLPLHLAVMSKCPGKLVKLLTVAHPGAAAVPDPLGRLPIHWAALTAGKLEVCEPLLEAHAAGVRVKDHEGRLPLHWAMSHRAPLEVVARLQNDFPRGRRMKDKFGMTPHSPPEGML